MNFRVGDGQSIALQSTLGGDAVLYLGFLAPPNALEHVQLMPATRQLVYLPDTGTPIVWQLRLTTAAPLGTVRVCGGVGGQIATSANTIGAEARSGSLDPGWSSVVDPTARGGRAARASGGTFVSWEVNMFGTPTMPRAGAYDVWYRVRVGSSAGHSPEMLLGVWDDQAPGSLGSNLYQPDQIGTAYLWVKVAAGIVPTPGHNVQFIAAFMGRLSTDWYIDSAVMVPSGSTAPL